MSLKLKVGPKADRQIRTAADWWVINRTKAPSAFVDDLEAALTLIEELPYAGEAVRHSRISNLRRVLLGQVQYHLYYSVSDDRTAIEVLALWHTSRGTKPPL